MAPSSIALFALAAVANAHFLLNHPATIGFDDDLEGAAPCGSFTPDFSKDNITDWHVSGDFISATLAHPQSNWLFRGTLDQTGQSNWTELFPIVQQSGLGDFCEPSVAVPSDWSGNKGLIGVVADGPDGILYQCAAVSFVDGTGSPSASTCSNATGVTASFTSDPALTALVGSSSSANGSSTTTSAMTGATSSKSAAAGLVEPGASPFGSLVVVGVMAILGAALL